MVLRFAVVGLLWDTNVMSTRFVAVARPCGHHFLVPSYQSKKIADYDPHCARCASGPTEKAKALPKPATPADVTKSLKERKS